jgi:hypothetical protein
VVLVDELSFKRYENRINICSYEDSSLEECDDSSLEECDDFNEFWAFCVVEICDNICNLGF